MSNLISESDVITVEWDGSVPHMVTVDSLEPVLDEVDMADLMWLSARLQEQTESMYR